MKTFKDYLEEADVDEMREAIKDMLAKADEDSIYELSQELGIKISSDNTSDDLMDKASTYLDGLIDKELISFYNKFKKEGYL